MWKRKLMTVFSDERGAALVEYVLIVGAIAIVAVGSLTTFGLNVRDRYEDLAALFP